VRPAGRRRFGALGRTDPALISVGVDLALAEAEQDVREALVADRRTVPDATRDLFPHEIRAGVRFAELDDAHAETAGAIDRIAGGVRQAVLAALAIDLEARTPAGVIRRLTDLVSPADPAYLPTVDRQVSRAAQQIMERLLELAELSAHQVIAETVAQGVAPAALHPLAPLAGEALELLAAQASAVAEAPAARALRVAADAVTMLPPGDAGAVRAAAVAAAEKASTAGVTDLARQAASRAAGLGRVAGANAGPPPARVYASELLDRATCLPCSHIDGTEYSSLNAALIDYPGAGAYRRCEGGARCRGTLVFVHDEAPPTPPPAGRVAPPPADPSEGLPVIDMLSHAGTKQRATPGLLRELLGRDPEDGERFYVKNAMMHGYGGDGYAEVHNYRLLLVEAPSAPEADVGLATLRSLAERVPEEYAGAVRSLVSWRGNAPGEAKNGRALATSDGPGIVVWNDTARSGLDVTAEEVFDHELGHSLAAWLGDMPADHPLAGIFTPRMGAGPRYAEAAAADSARALRGRVQYRAALDKANAEWIDTPWQEMDGMGVDWPFRRAVELLGPRRQRAALGARFMREDVRGIWALKPMGRSRWRGAGAEVDAVTEYAAAVPEMVEDISESHRLWLRDRRDGRLGESNIGEPIRFADLFPGRAALWDEVYGVPRRRR
jgi:hypothetical protein